MSANTAASPKATRPPDNARGIVWALAAAALFAAVDAMAKVAIADFHVLQILFFRQIVVFLSSMPSIAKSPTRSLRTHYPGLHVLRLCGAFVALSCGIWAVSVLPLTAAVTLSFAKVFFVALIAMHFLKESVGPHRIGAVIVGFIGVIIVMRPGGASIVDLNTLIPLASAVGAAVAATSVRTLSQTEATAILLIYQAVFVGILAGIPLFWLWVTPDVGGLVLLLSMGGLAAAGQWAGVEALRLGEASVVGNMDYVRLIYAALLGWLLFRDVPDDYTVVGAVIIIGSSAYLFHHETSSKRRALS